MTIYAINEQQVIHTCPADPTPHPIDIRRSIVHITPGRPCTNPITIRVGTTTTTVDCARHEPPERQCAGCRNTVVTREITVTADLGYQDATSNPAPAPSGLNPNPCPVCRQPVAAILDRHLFCVPRRTRQAA